MDCHEVGSYMRLLCYQWSKGSIPRDNARRERVAGGAVSEHVLSKFKVSGDGELKNERMEIERSKQEAYRESRSKNGQFGGRPRKAHDNHMVSICKPSGEAYTKAKKSSPSPSPSSLSDPILKSPTHTVEVHLGAKNGSCVFELKKLLGAEYGRKPEEHWTHNDEYSAAEIARRPGAIDECHTLLAFRKSLPMNLRRYFPQSIPKLLEGWGGCLDRARQGVPREVKELTLLEKEWQREINRKFD